MLNSSKQNNQCPQPVAKLVIKHEKIKNLHFSAEDPKLVTSATNYTHNIAA